MDKNKGNQEKNTKGEEDMNILEKELKSDLDLLWEIAEKNTKRNSEGLTVSSKDDCPYREEPGWEKTIKKSK